MGAVAQNPDRGTLSVTIIDASTGQPTPARVKLTSLDGQSYDFPREAIAIRWGRSDRYEGDVALRDSSFYVGGGFSMTLPAGRWRVAVTKGTEFVRQEYDVGTLGVEREFFRDAAHPATPGSAVVVEQDARGGDTGIHEVEFADVPKLGGHGAVQVRQHGTQIVGLLRLQRPPERRVKPLAQLAPLRGTGIAITH